MENKYTQNQDLEIDLKEIFYELKNNIWFIVLVTAITTISALMYSMFFITPVYTSTTSIYVLNKQQKETSNLTYSDLQTAAQLTGDYEILIKSRYVLETVISNLGLNTSSKRLNNSITVKIPEKTRVINISVANKDPYLARTIADSVREVASEQILGIMNIDAVNLVDAASLPIRPSSPNVSKNTMIGFLAGLVSSCALIVILFITNDKIKTPEDIEKYLHLSVLGVIPLQEAETKKKRKTKKNSSSKKGISNEK